MKQPIRAFSIGLFTSGIILLIVFSILGGINKKQTEPSAEEMIASLEDNGYHVLTDADYISLSVKNENQDTDKEDNNTKKKDESKEDSEKDKDKEDKKDKKDKKDKEDKEDKEKDDEEEEESNTYTLTIEEGMASSDISAELEDNNIIDKAGKFNRFLEEKGYELKVQIGTFEVSDDMDFEQIASTITK